MEFETILKIVAANVERGDHYAIAAQIYKAIKEPRVTTLKAALKQPEKRTRRTKEQMAAAATANAPIQLHQDAAE
jgi:hypothetical protein